MPPVAEDPALDWDLSPPGRGSRRMIIVVVSIVGAILLTISGWRALHPEPVPTPASTADATSGAVVLASPSGYNGDGGNPVGFPHTDLGAVSAAAAALEAEWTLDTAQAEQSVVLYVPPEQQDAARAGAQAAATEWRKTLGLPESGKLPDGAAMQTKTVGVQWRTRATDQVQVSLLVQVTATKGIGDPDPVYSRPHARTLLMAWQAGMRGVGDWVRIPDPVTAAAPEAAMPGTPEFTAAGWKPLSGPAAPTP